MARATSQKNNSHVGTFYASSKVENIVDRSQSTVIRRLLVDTGREYSWIPNLRVDSHLKKLVAAGPLLAASGSKVHDHYLI